MKFTQLLLTLTRVALNLSNTTTHMSSLGVPTTAFLHSCNSIHTITIHTKFSTKINTLEIFGGKYSTFFVVCAYIHVTTFAEYFHNSVKDIKHQTTNNKYSITQNTDLRLSTGSSCLMGTRTTTPPMTCVRQATLNLKIHPYYKLELHMQSQASIYRL